MQPVTTNTRVRPVRPALILARSCRHSCPRGRRESSKLWLRGPDRALRARPGPGRRGAEGGARPGAGERDVPQSGNRFRCRSARANSTVASDFDTRRFATQSRSCSQRSRPARAPSGSCRSTGPARGSGARRRSPPGSSGRRGCCGWARNRASMSRSTCCPCLTPHGRYPRWRPRSSTACAGSNGGPKTSPDPRTRACRRRSLVLA